MTRRRLRLVARSIETAYYLVVGVVLLVIMVPAFRILWALGSVLLTARC